MAARLCCYLDPERDVLCLRPLQAEPSGRPFSGLSRPAETAAAAAVPAFHGAHLSLRGLPSCAFSSAGPCALRFTSATWRCMETPMNSVTCLRKRTLGLRTAPPTVMEQYIKDCLFEQWEEQGEEPRLKVFVLGGCRHKLVGTASPCIFFTSA
ncbi:X protein [Woolly monkey hepatitis B virus]|uniref:Protein X n=1 Tax=Woolly monkey hepatitis B virus (isolate Louisville) TaxID=490134 RepID=X_WMHBV|nr:X protein [Woolly monkey hepatitis B virus]O71302.1 RecName: Full=Protein X; AltName: Full=HBx; AltName: Full=Peptide X; AltName: Full=pX [Hepatitis B virus Woolly monkey/Louisville]AAC16907.1 X protein [Woolly monkey hepatitis B virus]